MSAKPKILIVGGGIAGPALAAFLYKDADITIIDKSPSWNDPGYLISLSDSGRQILKELEIENRVTKDGREISGFSFCDKHGREIRKIAFDPFGKYGPFTVIKRHDLHSPLVGKIHDKAEIHTDLDIDGIRQVKGGAIVRFSDGSEGHFDLVVGADGIKSRVRDLTFGGGHVKHLGWTIWLLWVPKDIVSPSDTTLLSAKGRCALIHPGKKDTLLTLGIRISSDNPDLSKDKKTYLRRMFHDFDPQIVKAIEETPHPSQIFRFDMRNVQMNDWYKGRVVLMGDAQHGMPPLTGMGSSMALEDAFVLAKELIYYDFDDIDKALRQYAKKRQKRVQNVRYLTKNLERWMVANPLMPTFVKNAVVRLAPQSYVTKLMEKILSEEV